MPSGIWHGTIAFGLVNVPVKMYTATTDHDIRFHQVHAEDGGRVRYERVCSECGHRPVDILDIDRLYKSPAGERVIVSDTDLARLPAAEKSEIEVLQFIPSDQLDPIHLDRTYNLDSSQAVRHPARTFCSLLSWNALTESYWCTSPCEQRHG